jgi:hypothetical protein
MGNFSTIIFLLLVCAVTVVVDRYFRYRRLVAITPPSYKPLPFLGNLLAIPTKAPWKTYAAWSKELNSASPSLNPTA